MHLRMNAETRRIYCPAYLGRDGGRRSATIVRFGHCKSAWTTRTHEKGSQAGAFNHRRPSRTRKYVLNKQFYSITLQEAATSKLLTTSHVTLWSHLFSVSLSIPPPPHSRLRRLPHPSPLHSRRPRPRRLPCTLPLHSRQKERHPVLFQRSAHRPCDYPRASILAQLSIPLSYISSPAITPFVLLPPLPSPPSITFFHSSRCASIIHLSLLAL